MPTSYTSLLGLALPVTGELSGTWGDTVNDYISKYIDASVAGTQTISGSQTAVTLSVTNGTALTQAVGGSSGSAQYQVINCTGNPAGLLTITAPAASKTYLIINATSTSQSVKIVGTGPTTGVTVAAGEKVVVAWNGSDFVRIAAYGGTGEFTLVDTTNLEVTNIKAKDGTASATIANTTGAFTVSAPFALSGGTANGVAYLNASKVLTTGSALTFDGTEIGTTSTGLNINNANALVRFQNGSGTRRGYLQVRSDAYEIWSDQAAVPMVFGVANSEQMRLTSTGLGIGTSSPTLLFQVGSRGGMASNGVFQWGSALTGNNRGVLSWDTNIATIGAVQNLVFCANSETTERMRLDASGNLGIGTSSPGSKLTVSGTGTTAITYVKNTDNFTGGTNFTEPHLAVNSGNTVTGNVTRLALTVGSGGQVYFDSLMEDGATAYSSLLIRTRGAGGVLERARIDSAGNLGLGVTPSAWTLFKALELGNVGTYISGRPSGNQLNLAVNTYYNSGSKYANTGVAATMYEQEAGAHKWYTAPSGTAGNAITFSQVMTLDASGNLGIGTSSPGSFGKLAVAGGNIHAVDQNFTAAAGGGYWASGVSTYNVGWYESSGSMLFRSGTGATTNMRLDSSGNLGLGVTPSAWNTTEYRAMQIGLGASFYGRRVAGDADKAGMAANAVFDQTDNRWEYIATDSASRYDQTGGGHYWYTAPSGTAGNAITFTEQFRVDSTGISFSGAITSGTWNGTAIGVAYGGTGATTAATARTNLGATTVGANLFTLTNPSAVTFPRFNADNTVSALDAATFRTAIGAGTGNGSVTSVDVSGGTTGLTTSGGPITGSGTITLAGTLAVANGGTGATTAAAGFDALKQAATTTYVGAVELATDAEAAAGTDSTRAITPATLRSGLAATGSAPVYAARAWVNFNGTGTVAIRGSGNVSSITDNGTGDYTVNFTTALTDTNYGVVGTGETGITGYNEIHVLTTTAPTTGAVRIGSVTQSGGTPTAWDSARVSVSVFR